MKPSVLLKPRRLEVIQPFCLSASSTCKFFNPRAESSRSGTCSSRSYVTRERLSGRRQRVTSNMLWRHRVFVCWENKQGGQWLMKVITEMKRLLFARSLLKPSRAWKNMKADARFWMWELYWDDCMRKHRNNGDHICDTCDKQLREWLAMKMTGTSAQCDVTVIQVVAFTLS